MSAVGFLENIDCPAYKFSSFEITDLNLIRYIASKRKPMIISTGMANLLEIEEAIEVARNSGCEKVALLLCVSAYPALAEDFNFRTLVDMAKRFNVPVGLSDHSMSNDVAVASIALGACVVDKHFTLDRSAGGPDDSFSLEPKQLKQLVDSSKAVYTS